MLILDVEKLNLLETGFVDNAWKEKKADQKRFWPTFRQP